MALLAARAALIEALELPAGALSRGAEGASALALGQIRAAQALQAAAHQRA